LFKDKIKTSAGFCKASSSDEYTLSFWAKRGWLRIINRAAISNFFMGMKFVISTGGKRKLFSSYVDKPGHARGFH
jgi:hypothetical protein